MRDATTRGRVSHSLSTVMAGKAHLDKNNVLLENACMLLFLLFVIFFSAKRETKKQENKGVDREMTNNDSLNYFNYVKL